MRYKALLILIALMFSLCSCNNINYIDTSTTQGDNKDFITENTTPQGDTINTELSTTTQPYEESESIIVSEKETVNSAETETEHTMVETETVPAIMGVTIPDKKADMFYTDDVNNKFIQAVAKKYNISPEGLACVYAVPDDDTNQVWQFSSNERNPDTLKYVYLVSADCKTIYRAGGVTGNDGMDITMGILTFQVAKQQIIPLFQEKLNK